MNYVGDVVLLMYFILSRKLNSTLPINTNKSLMSLTPLDGEP